MTENAESLNYPPTAYAKKLPQAKQIYLIDFFCGCGGMSWGFANTRQSHTAFKILGGIDINRAALNNYERNVGAPAIEADISKIGDDPSLLLQLIPDFDPATCRPLVFSGCAPCQGFSAHRRKDKRDDFRNTLLKSFADICAYYLPDSIVIENVPEILRGRYQKHYQLAESELLGSGYKLSKGVMDLSLFGVPQRRRRAIVLGSLSGPIDLPKPIFKPESVITVRQAISHLPPILSGEQSSVDPSHRAPEHSARILDRIAKTPPDGGDRRDLPQDEQLECHASVDAGDTPGFTDVYGRLRWDTPSVTITAKSSTPSCGRFLHPEQHRNISIREAAILQGFPQSFQFIGPLVQQYRQIGEAVPPLFARFLAWQMLDHLSPRTDSASVADAVPSVQDDQIERKAGFGGMKVVDGFCGAGGIALGFKSAGLETALAFDLDSDAVATFRQNISSNADQLSVTDPALIERIDEAIGPSRFVLAGGPPCQGFSQQRRGDPYDERNNLIVKFADLLLRLQNKPSAVVLENVTYLDSPRGRGVFAEYCRRLTDLGYKTFRHDLNSADYGVPQLRRRIIVVALLSQFAETYTGPAPITPRRWLTVGEVLNDLVADNEAPLLNFLANNEPSNEGPVNRQRIAFVDMGQGRLSIPNYLQLNCHKKYGGHLDVYGRLDWFSQARTITGGFDSFTRGEYAHPFLHRSITPREAARIQGFPDWFIFNGNRASVRQQIGNAVPPPMAMAIAKGILEAISNSAELKPYVRDPQEFHVRPQHL